MLGVPDIDDQQVTIVVPLFVTIACIMTVLRLADRIYTRRFGWDDSFAVICMIFMLLTTLFCFLYLAPSSTQLGVIAYYGADLCFLATVWSARISITFSIIRIVVHRAHKRWLYGQVALFLTMYFLLIAQEFWTCEPEPGWKTIQNPRPQCNLGLPVAITQLVFDVFADILITVVPIHIFAKMKLDKSVRLRFILLFSSTILITIVSVVHDVLVFRTGGLDEAFAAMIEDAIALCVCNLTVIVTTGIRLFSRKREDMDTDAQSPKGPGSSGPRSFGVKSLGFGRIGGTSGISGAIRSHRSRRAGDDFEMGLETAMAPDDISLSALPVSKEDVSDADAASYLDIKGAADIEEGQPFAGQNYARRTEISTSPGDHGIWLERQVHVIPDLNASQ